MYGPAPVLLSVAVMVKLTAPLAVGVPVIAPALESVRPAGRAPLVIAKVYGPVPPLAVTVCEYAVPTAGAGSVLGETVTVGALTVKEYELVPLNGAPAPVEESVALMLKLKGPPAVGVPLSKPPVVSVMPAGNDPLETTKVYGVVPPPADICCEYAAAIVAAVSVDGDTVIADGAPTVMEYACVAV